MMIANKPLTLRCPSCGSEWMQHDDGTWANDPVFTDARFMAYRYDPLPAGRKYCPACAEASADTRDRADFIRQNCLENAFLTWLVQDAPRDDLVAIMRALTKADPDLMDTRLDEYIFDMQRRAFEEWRCGYEYD